MSSLILHIGYPKTGTTFLQSNIFPYCKNINYIGRYYGEKRNSEKSLLLSELIKEIQFSSVFKPNSIKNKLDTLVDTYSKPVVLSHELLLRPFFLTRNIERLSKITKLLNFDDIIILFTIRRQDQLIWSRFQHDSNVKKFQHQRKNSSLEKCLELDHIFQCSYPQCMQNKNFKCYCSHTGYKKISLPFYNFLNMVTLYSAYFDNIKILPIELLNQSPKRYLENLSNIVGVELNSDLASQNKKINSSDQRSKIPMNPEYEIILNKIITYFSYSNKILSSKYDLNLEFYNYFTQEFEINDEVQITSNYPSEVSEYISKNNPSSIKSKLKQILSSFH